MHRIFLLSSERSGSNLIRKLVGEKFNLNTPSAIHLLKAYLKYHKNSNNLNYDDYVFLIDHLKLLSKVHWMPWESNIDVNELATKSLNGKWTFLDIFDYFYQTEGVENSAGYFIKENNVFDYTISISSYFGDSAKFVYLIRDPRDVYASYKKVPGGPKDAASFVKIWRREQELCLDFLQSIEESNYITIRYEDLITNSNETIAAIHSRFNLPKLLKQGKNKKEVVDINSPYFKNYNKPIIKDNKNKFLKELNDIEIGIIQNTVGELMKKFSYEKVGSKKVSGLMFFVYRIINNKILSAIKKYYLSLKLYNKKERTIRKKRVNIYNKIKNYPFR